jgi:hypothetical protein
VEFEGGWRRKGGALVRLLLRSGFEGFLSQGTRLGFRRSWTRTGSRFDKAETLLCCCAALSCPRGCFLLVFLARGALAQSQSKLNSSVEMCA